MIDSVRNALAFAVIAPLAVGLLSLLTQVHVVRDRKSRTGQGWDARDTFEIKDAMLAAITWLIPAGLAYVFVAAKPNLPAWQWWSVLLAIPLAILPFSIWYGRWSIAQRKALEQGYDRKET